MWYYGIRQAHFSLLCGSSRQYIVVFESKHHVFTMRILCLCSFLTGLLGSMAVVRDLSGRLTLESGLFFGGNISKYTFFGKIAR